MVAAGWLALASGCPESDCYSPEQNLDKAYAQGAIGCGCSDADEDQCVDGVALVCENGRWHAVEDGPCFPALPDACYSPTQNLEHAYDEGAQGCACSDSDHDQCIGRVALICEDGFWHAVEDGPCEPGPAQSECYSPTENLEHAYDGTLTGCACDASDAEVCVDGVALICEDGAWHAVEDGPCEPNASLCAGDIVASENDCAQDASCVRLEDGRYCSGGVPSTCPVGAKEIGADEACPAHAHCWDQAEGLRCRSDLYTPDECTKQGGVAVADPGDGSVVGVGCPDGGRVLGVIDADWDEGGLCCLPQVSCGGWSGDTCSDTQFCDYQEGELCGAADASSLCHERPTACTKEEAPVCACDGNSYANACTAHAAGHGILHAGACE